MAGCTVSHCPTSVWKTRALLPSRPRGCAPQPDSLSKVGKEWNEGPLKEYEGVWEAWFEVLIQTDFVGTLAETPVSILKTLSDQQVEEDLPATLECELSRQIVEVKWLKVRKSKIGLFI